MLLGANLKRWLGVVAEEEEEEDPVLLTDAEVCFTCHKKESINY
jgi:hypothetical protein